MSLIVYPLTTAYHSCLNHSVVVLAFRHFPFQQLKKVWSTKLLERGNEEIKRRTR